MRRNDYLLPNHNHQNCIRSNNNNNNNNNNKNITNNNNNTTKPTTTPFSNSYNTNRNKYISSNLTCTTSSSSTTTTTSPTTNTTTTNTASNSITNTMQRRLLHYVSFFRDTQKNNSTTTTTSSSYCLFLWKWIVEKPYLASMLLNAVLSVVLIYCFCQFHTTTFSNCLYNNDDNNLGMYKPYYYYNTSSSSSSNNNNNPPSEWIAKMNARYMMESNSLQLYNGQMIAFHGGNPVSHMIQGSCWCSNFETNHHPNNNNNDDKKNIPTTILPYCMCTPSLAIDLVIVTKNNNDNNNNNNNNNKDSTNNNNEPYVWLVRRKDTNQLATMGGFVKVGETVEETVIRELKEETGIDIIKHQQQLQLQQQQSSLILNKEEEEEEPIILHLFGVYSDPRRDNRRHTTSIVYAIHLDGTEKPIASDDVKEMIRIPMTDIELYNNFFADHKTILLDYRKLYYQQQQQLQQQQQQQQQQQLTYTDFMTSSNDFTNNIHRSICQPLYSDRNGGKTLT